MSLAAFSRLAKYKEKAFLAVSNLAQEYNDIIIRARRDRETQIKNRLRRTGSLIINTFYERLSALIPIDYRCGNNRFWLSAQNCQVPTPTSQNL